MWKSCVRIEYILLILTYTLETCESYLIQCYENADYLEDYSRYEIKVDEYYGRDTMLFIQGCAVPQRSYAEFLKRRRMNIFKLRTLVPSLPEEPTSCLQEDSFEDLPISKLSLISNYEDANPCLSMNFSNSLPNLKTLQIYGIELPPMSPSSKLETVLIMNGRSNDAFGGCENLSSLKISNWNWLKQPNGWLAACAQLKHIVLEAVSSDIIVILLQGLRYLNTLTISENEMTDHELDILFNNYLRNRTMTSLEELRITENNLQRGFLIIERLQLVPNLRILDISKNKLFELCNNPDMADEPAPEIELTHGKLRSIILDNTNTSSIQCIKTDGLPSLQILSLMDTNILTLLFQELPLSQMSLVIKLSKKTSYINFTVVDYNLLSINSTLQRKISLEFMELDCDCQHEFLVKAIRNHLIYAPNAICKDVGTYTRGTDLLSVPSAILECEKFKCGDCICRRKNSSVEAKCRYATRIPSVPGLTRIEAPYNRIKLFKDDIPVSLKFLDLTGNGIRYLDDDVVEELFSVNDRYMFLKNNYIVCNCLNEYFIQSLQNHKEQIRDYMSLHCEHNETLLIQDIAVDTLCTLPEGHLILSYSLIILIIVGMISTFFLTLLLLHINERYGRTIRIYLHSKGLSCINEDTIDADKSYDVFVSFCYSDDALVLNNFVPHLEKLGYKVCIHYRDWIPGDLIPVQIVRSVESSRRTVILLSRTFVESLWGLMEFKVAHERALKENLTRVIVVVLDDVLEAEDLNKNLRISSADVFRLRIYLSSNTYIRYDDGWFWQKLCYALPVPRNPPMITDEEAMVDDPDYPDNS